MVQLNILSGKMAGTVWVARRFPILIGRSAKADLKVEESGVWEQHLRIDLAPKEGLVATAEGDALTAINGQPIQRTLMHNGDLIELGSLKLQFWLSRSRQVGLGFREWLTWAGIAIVSLAQVGLVYWLLHG